MESGIINKNCTSRRISVVEVVLNNKVDKDIQSMFLPLNLAQKIVAYPKFCIKNDFITPNGTISVIISLIATIIFISLFIYRIVMLNIYLQGYRQIMFFTSIFDFIYYCVAFVMYFVIGITQTRNYVKFILTIQKIHRVLNDKITSKSFIIWNWINISLPVGYYLIVYIYFFMRLNVPYYINLCSFCLVSFDLSIVCASRYIKLLADKVVLWNIKSLNSQNVENYESHADTVEMFQVYIDIMDCYNVYKVFLHKIILFYTIEVFIHSLVYIQMTIKSLKLSLLSNIPLETILLTILSTSSWFLKDLFLHAKLAQNCEKFYKAIEHLQGCCSYLLSTNCSDADKRLYKNIQRLHRVSFNKINACGLFCVDAALLLHMLSLVSTYTIVLLQFAFL